MTRSDKPMRFRPGKRQLQFTCDWAVFPEKGNSSMCYCTDKTRATMIAMALNRFVKTDDFKRWMAKRSKPK